MVWLWYSFGPNDSLLFLSYWNRLIGTQIDERSNFFNWNFNLIETSNKNWSNIIITYWLTNQFTHSSSCWWSKSNSLSRKYNLKEIFQIILWSGCWISSLVDRCIIYFVFFSFVAPMFWTFSIFMSVAFTWLSNVWGLFCETC